jgi:hypothetical protein
MGIGMTEERVVAPGEFYRHFKDKLYQVMGVAYDSETGEKCVVYQALYGEYKWYVRPYDMFVSEVDHVKYPDVKQKYRFEKVGLTEASGKARDEAHDVVHGEAHDEAHDVVHGEARDEAHDVAHGEAHDVVYDDAQDKVRDLGEGGINPLLIQFLDADSYREKLNVLALVHLKMDERLLSDIALSMDEVLPEGSLEEQFASLKNCVMTHAKYEESNRLR